MDFENYDQKLRIIHFHFAGKKEMNGSSKEKASLRDGPRPAPGKGIFIDIAGR